MNTNKVILFTADPYTSCAMQVLSCCPKGYRFLKMNRKGNEVEATYRKVERPKGEDVRP